MRKITLIVVILLTLSVKAQVGISTQEPEATLDIRAKSDNNSNSIEGLLIPRVSKEKAYKMATNGSKLKESTMIYVDNATSSTSDPKINKITKKGYYFWNGSEWTAEWNTDSRNIYNSNGTISEDRTVTLSGTDRKLTFDGGQVVVKEESYYPLAINSTNTSGGGLAVHPNDWDKRIEFSVNKNGHARIWAGDNRIIIKRDNGYVAIGNNYNPKQQLDVGENAYIRGNLGVNVESPSERLEVSGNAKISGNLEVTSSIKQTSDKKFKERIEPLGKGISYILALNPVTYYWNEKGVQRGGEKDVEQIGFIAQEVEKILPNIVATDGEGNKSINYIQIIPFLTKAIQELKEQNRALQDQIQDLTYEVGKLKESKN